MPETTSQVEVLYQRAIDQDSKARVFHIVQNLVHPPTTEAKLLKCLSRKSLTHMVVGVLHVELDCHQALTNRDPLQVMHKL